ncbi:MAG: hypothetical protein KZQ99_03295 [Candidatus Thiodiazotropha sp. (ex Dulcina madagascariensis)]|nr:hypothetical protein [Candidatus Thiodiazotropha sp. (ex Dulcina madagascariensis)]
MATSMLHTDRLALTPADPYLTPQTPASLVQRLREIGFAADALASASATYLLGKRFMQLVGFVGCSPHIRLEPNPAGEPFCHLILSGPSPQPRFIKGQNTTPPHCGRCQKRVTDWESLMQAWENDPDRPPVTCPHCGQTQHPANFNWRQSAGCGRFMLFVENIFPREAVPTAELLSQLQSLTQNRPWRYFYIQDHPRPEERIV